MYCVLPVVSPAVPCLELAKASALRNLTANKFLALDPYKDLANAPMDKNGLPQVQD